MFPVQTAPVRFRKPAKPVFFDVGCQLGNAPLGCVGLVCEGGGRFDSDVLTSGWQEDSFWVGGYYGPRLEVIPEKVAAAMAPIPPGVFYVIDQESWKTSLRFNTDEEVEDAIRHFRAFFLAAQKARPDLRFGVYGITPDADYWVPATYDMGLKAWQRLQKNGIASFSDWDRWQVSHVASNKTDYNTYIWDDETDTNKAFQLWHKANRRLGVGLTATGSINGSGGVTDLVDAMFPSLYDPYVGNDDESVIRWAIEESRATGSGRPVYPFLWGRYHDSNPDVGGQPIPLDEWRWRCRLVFQLADGAVLWATGDLPDHVRIAQEEAERASPK